MSITVITKILTDDSGATAIEYGLIAALVSVAALLGLSAAGGALTALFTRVSVDLNAALGT